jgi:hypothetical protein
VTTGNDEIIVYALRSEDASANTGTIGFQADLSVPRDAYVDTDGSLVGEETITITNVDLTGLNPPYTLVRMSFADDGTVEEQLVVSNLRTVLFSYQTADELDYYCTSANDDGTCSTGNQVPFITVGGDEDLSAGDGQRRSARAGVRRISAEFIGLTDHDDFRWNEPTDTLLPTRRRTPLGAIVTPNNLGLRGAPDLESNPAIPPENVSACIGQCDLIRVEWDESEGASGYVVNLYLSGQVEPFFAGNTPGVLIQGTSPVRHYAVYDRTDAAEIAAGAEIIATVQSRTGKHTVSVESDPSSAVTVADLVRPGPPDGLVASGYDDTAAGWPDVVGSAISPDTTGTGPYPAEPNAITVYWTAPVWSLDVTDQSDPANAWTTALDDGTLAALSCDTDGADIDDDGTDDKTRTRSRELYGDVRYLVFRSTDPRFVPTADDLIAETTGTSAGNGMLSYTDRAAHSYRSGIFNSTDNALANCETYWYRVRAVDACWDGTDPASSSSLSLSPFHPPLDTDATATNSDDASGLAASAVGLAIPGYAIPAAPPGVPSEVRFTNHDADTADGDDHDATIGFDAVKQDTSVPPEDVSITTYAVFSHATDSTFSLSNAKLGLGGVTLEALIPVWDLEALRIAYDDEDGSGGVSASEDESEQPSVVLGSPISSLRIELPSDGSGRWWRVAAIQCADEFTVPSGDPIAYDYGELSAAVWFPCEFGGGASSAIDVDTTDFDNSVTATATVADPTVTATHARLVLVDPTTGDRAISTEPGEAVDASGVVVFDHEHILALTNNFGTGTYDISVEMVDSNGCYGTSDVESTTGGSVGCCIDGGAMTQDDSNPLLVSDLVSETCSLNDVQIYEFYLEIDNATGGRFERLQSVSWGADVIWSGNKVSETIDLRASPIELAEDGMETLTVEFDRDAAGNNLTVRYSYRIAGSPGECSFTGEIQP